MTEAELDYKKRLRSMDDILHQISRMDLAENKEGLSDTIPSLLKSIGNYTCADRFYLFEWATKEHLALSNTYEWCASKVSPQKKYFTQYPARNHGYLDSYLPER